MRGLEGPSCAKRGGLARIRTSKQSLGFSWSSVPVYWLSRRRSKGCFTIIRCVKGVLCQLASGARSLSVQVKVSSGGGFHDTNETHRGPTSSGTARCKDSRQHVPTTDRRGG